MMKNEKILKKVLTNYVMYSNICVVGLYKREKKERLIQKAMGICVTHCFLNCNKTYF